MYNISTLRWRYGCAGLHNLLTGFLNSDILYYKITGFGFYSPEDPLNRGFHIDRVSFSSEKKTLDLMTVSTSLELVVN